MQHHIFAASTSTLAALVTALCASSATAQALDIDISTELAGFTAGRPAQLAPPPDGDRSCFAAPPTSVGGQLVDALGWHVTSEAPLGPYTLVSFAAGANEAGGGACAISGGNIGVFSDDHLLGLIWAEGDMPFAIGGLEALENGAVRLRDGDVLSLPTADIALTAAGHIALAPLPERESVCGGSMELPLRYGQPIATAREAYLAAGWEVEITPPEARDPQSIAFAEGGVPEADSCSGTGLNFCSFRYTNGPDLLQVVTAGEGVPPEGPTVVGQNVSCGG
ncbi:hypothetical protein BVG79_00063 [Ketogulonicigenium robustum]|uniref:Uncharacterized protein n=1 Tax=Ketogulonicigenium robustum TaxID=92947 RepID=A0A1W6NWA4_9RHOB|nr:hypothetical protein [Ketogulonicigenium robustum]ARO13423.1 hypothetical protein BVG79_00063 [Ketogulonicigenium robustum]